METGSVGMVSEVDDELWLLTIHIYIYYYYIYIHILHIYNTRGVLEHKRRVSLPSYVT